MAAKTLSPGSEINCHPSVWKRLVAIDARRDTAKNRHQDQLKLKRDLEAELARVGKKPSKERSKLCEAHWDCLCAIKYELNRQRTLADLMGEAIKKGIQGELFAADDEDLDAEIEKAMAGGDEDEGDQEDAATRATAPIDYEAAIGRPRKPEAPAVAAAADTPGEPASAAAGPKPEDPPVWHKYHIDLEFVDPPLDGKSARALRDAGLITLGDVVRYHEDNYGNSRLTKLGVTGKDEMALEETIRWYSEGDVDGDEAPAAGDNGQAPPKKKPGKKSSKKTAKKPGKSAAKGSPAVTAGGGDDVPRCAICEHPLRGSDGRERVELAPGPGGKPRYGLACTACSDVRRKSEA